MGSEQTSGRRSPEPLGLPGRKTSRASPHALRRAWATHALNDADDPVPIDVVSSVLRHAEHLDHPSALREDKARPGTAGPPSPRSLRPAGRWVWGSGSLRCFVLPNQSVSDGSEGEQTPTTSVPHGIHWPAIYVETGGPAAERGSARIGWRRDRSHLGSRRGLAIAALAAAFRWVDTRRRVVGRLVAVPWALGEAQGRVTAFTGPAGAPRVLVDIEGEVLAFNAAHVRFVRRPRPLDRVWRGGTLSSYQLVRQR